MSFAEAVQSTPEIAECLKPGLQALRTNSSNVKVRMTRDLKGSVDIGGVYIFLSVISRAAK